MSKPRYMNVWKSLKEKTFKIRIVLCEMNGKFLAVDKDTEKEFLRGGEFKTEWFNHANHISTQKTVEEVAECLHK